MSGQVHDNKSLMNQMWTSCAALVASLVLRATNGEHISKIPNNLQLSEDEFCDTIVASSHLIYSLV